MVVHILNKDISYDLKLNEPKNLSFLGKTFKFRALLFKFHNNAPRLLNTD